jgi:hypothetical protein
LCASLNEGGDDFAGTPQSRCDGALWNAECFGNLSLREHLDFEKYEDRTQRFRKSVENPVQLRSSASLIEQLLGVWRIASVLLPTLDAVFTAQVHAAMSFASQVNCRSAQKCSLATHFDIIEPTARNDDGSLSHVVRIR